MHHQFTTVALTDYTEHIYIRGWGIGLYIEITHILPALHHAINDMIMTMMMSNPFSHAVPQTFFSWDCAWALRLLICCWDRDAASSFSWDARSRSWRSATSLSSSMILERSDTVATYSTECGKDMKAKEEETGELGCVVWNKYLTWLYLRCGTQRHENISVLIKFLATVMY